MMARDPEMLAVKVEGEQHYIKLHDQRLLEAMKNLGPEQLNAFMRVMLRANRVLAALNTSLNPEFVVSNAARDIQTAIVNVLAEETMPGGRLEGKSLAKQIVRDTPTAIRNAYRGFRDKAGGDPEWQGYFKEYRETGAKIGFFGLRDLEKRSIEMKRLLLEAQGGAIGNTLRAQKALGRFIEDTNSAVENGVRLSTYVNARRAGLNAERAASLAKNLTVDFNKHGEIGVALNSLYLFANASIQGTAVFLRSMRSRQVRLLAAGMVGAAFALAELNRLIGGQDDDDEPNWDDVAPHIRERNLVVMNPFEEGDYFTFPLPYGYNSFYVAGYLANDLVHGAKQPQQAAAEMAGALIGAFNPIGLQQSDDTAKALAKTVAPTVLTPIVQIAVNETFYGAPLSTEQPFGSPRPDSALKRASTPPAYQDIAAFLNRATGGDAEVSGLVDVAPESFRHWWQFITGGAGATIDRAYGVVEGVIGGMEIPTNEIPFVRRLMGEVTDTSDRLRFYERRDEIEQTYRQFESLEGEEARAYRDEHREELRLRFLSHETDKQIREIRIRRRDIDASSQDDERRETKIERLDEKEATLIDRFNRRYNKAMNQ